MIPAFASLSFVVYKEREAEQMPRMEDKQQVIGAYRGVFGEKSKESDDASCDAAAANTAISSPQRLFFLRRP